MVFHFSIVTPGRGDGRRDLHLAPGQLGRLLGARRTLMCHFLIPKPLPISLLTRRMTAPSLGARLVATTGCTGHWTARTSLAHAREQCTWPRSQALRITTEAPQPLQLNDRYRLPPDLVVGVDHRRFVPDSGDGTPYRSTPLRSFRWPWVPARVPRSRRLPTSIADLGRPSESRSAVSRRNQTAKCKGAFV
jgi:hypothetical protein